MAEKLLSGLSGESKRWKVKLKILKDDEYHLSGNILLAAAIIAYLGPFTLEFRNYMLQEWIVLIEELKIPVMS